MFSWIGHPEVGRVGGLLMALGSLLLALSYTYKPYLEDLIGIKLDVLEDYRLRYVFFALAVIGAIMVLAWLIFRIVEHLLIRFPRQVLEKIERLQSALDHFILEPCTDADIVEISILAQDQFGILATTLERNRWLAGIDDTAFTKVIDNKRRIVVFYDVFRLTKMGADAAHRGEFNITTCPREYIRADAKRKYNFIYIGGVYGRNRRAKAMVLGAIHQRALELKPRVVFAGAGTKDGLRLLERASFRPAVPHLTGVGEMYIKALRAI
jgi:hypothetical protein